MGPLPEAGKWVRLEIPVEKLGLAAGDQITGFALTQFGGTVYWDKLGAAGRTDPARDPLHSFIVWWRQATGKDTPGIPPDLAQLAKSGPEKKPKAEDEKRLLTYYLKNVCVDTKPQLSQAVQEIDKLKAEREALEKSLTSTFIFTDLPNPRDSFVMMRGAVRQAGRQGRAGDARRSAAAEESRSQGGGPRGSTWPAGWSRPSIRSRPASP